MKKTDQEKKMRQWELRGYLEYTTSDKILGPYVRVCDGPPLVDLKPIVYPYTNTQESPKVRVVSVSDVLRRVRSWNICSKLVDQLEEDLSGVIEKRVYLEDCGEEAK